MTSRQRMLTAMRGGAPDRVPASPDTNWMIPTRPGDNVRALVDVCAKYGRY